MSDYRTIVVPYDFSEHADAALTTAADLAAHFGSDLHLLFVVPLATYAYANFPAANPTVPGDMIEISNAAMTSLREVADKVGGASTKVESHVVEGVSIAEQICLLAEELDANLIVMGTHGRTGLAHVFIGSVAERTLRSAPCPVLTVQKRNDDEE